MRIVRALSDVTVGTVIVLVHVALADRLAAKEASADPSFYEVRERPRGLRRVSWPRRTAERRAVARR
jgi:hypothetical protein